MKNKSQHFFIEQHQLKNVNKEYILKNLKIFNRGESNKQNQRILKNLHVFSISIKNKHYNRETDLIE